MPDIELAPEEVTSGMPHWLPTMPPIVNVVPSVWSMFVKEVLTASISRIPTISPGNSDSSKYVRSRPSA
jgi:hypothetical protein